MTWMDNDHDLFLGPLVDSWEETPVDLPRIDFDEPPLSTNPAAPAAFVRPRWEYTRVQEEEFGGDSDPDRAGNFYIELWIQPGSGGRARELLSALWTLYSNADLEPFRGQSPIPMMAGRLFDGRGQRWWVEGLQWPFQIHR